ncbi:pyruvate kinase [Mycoplasma marinum]|uniref:Pyruvate kinase n=1 Tax=Mycoplasma marinum TaxID=1937190 RepID=A0A4R0XVB5_9MOLU|nr:pyruvate kinase [Mycoplasma marinum]TCG11780.1 pyruvate kinase [Mycoplasma marinum]
MHITDKRTKLVATIGPSSDSVEMLTKLAEAGMTTIRANFSHGDRQEQFSKMEKTWEVQKTLNRPISVLLDTKGPEIRVGKLAEGFIMVETGEILTVMTGKEDFAKHSGVKGEFSVSYEMHLDVKKGDRVLFDDGKLVTYVQEVKQGQVIVKAINSHKLKSNKRINLPGIDFSLPFLAQKDKDDVVFGIESGINYVAASFVNTAANVNELRELMDNAGGKHVQLFSKIESVLGIENIDAIIEASDGIMVARGDLGLEIPFQDVPFWEKYIVRKCREAGKPVIVATQMLDSMESSPQPTRAEVTDVYFATELGSDATMLSGESALGQFPVESVEVMSIINMRAEREFYNKLYYPVQLEEIRKFSTGERSDIAYEVAKKTQNADYRFVVVLSRTGALLKEVAKFRPNTAVIGILDDEKLIGGFGITSSVFVSLDSKKLFEEIKSNPTSAREALIAYGAEAGDKFLVVENEKTTEFVF